MGVDEYGELVDVLYELKEVIKASLMSGPKFTVGSFLLTSKTDLRKALRLLGYSPKRARELLEAMERCRLIRRLDDNEHLVLIPFPELIREYARSLRGHQRTSQP